MKESVLCKSATRPCVGRAADARLSGDRYCLIREIVNHSAGCQSLLLEVGEHTALEPFGFLEVSVRHIGGHVLIMKEGRMVEQGSAKEVLQNPKVGYTRELIEAIHLGWG